MYDDPYRLLPDDVEVVVHTDHANLNDAVAELLARGETLDLISTHGKYVPSQAAWLRDLHGIVDAEVLAGIAPAALDLCSFRGALLCLPRNIDVRVLWWRTDRLAAAPTTWAEVIASGEPFGFTGYGSGLVGLFYELVVSAGGALFDDDVRPTFFTEAAHLAINQLVALAAQAPADCSSWGYDDVDDALLDGDVSMAAAWPGGTARIRASALSPRLRPARYPGGLSYSGCHGWAIPQTCRDVDGALDLLSRLSGPEATALEMARGTVPANVAALAARQPDDAVDAERLAVTIDTIATGMLTYPPLAGFPTIEDAGWAALGDAAAGIIDADTALRRLQAVAVAVCAEERAS